MIIWPGKARDGLAKTGTMKIFPANHDRSCQVVPAFFDLVL